MVFEHPPFPQTCCKSDPPASIWASFSASFWSKNLSFRLTLIGGCDFLDPPVPSLLHFGHGGATRGQHVHFWYHSGPLLVPFLMTLELPGHSFSYYPKSFGRLLHQTSLRKYAFAGRLLLRLLILPRLQRRLLLLRLLIRLPLR